MSYVIFQKSAFFLGGEGRGAKKSVVQKQIYCNAPRKHVCVWVCHSIGFTHTDLKLENVLFVDDGYKQIHVVTFFLGAQLFRLHSLALGLRLFARARLWRLGTSVQLGFSKTKNNLLNLKKNRKNEGSSQKKPFSFILLVNLKGPYVVYPFSARLDDRLQKKEWKALKKKLFLIIKQKKR